MIKNVPLIHPLFSISFGNPSTVCRKASQESRGDHSPFSFLGQLFLSREVIHPVPIAIGATAVVVEVALPAPA